MRTTEALEGVGQGPKARGLAYVFVRNTQLSTALSAASCEYATAVSRSHTCTESVLILSLEVRWLERSFHLVV